MLNTPQAVPLICKASVVQKLIMTRFLSLLCGHVTDGYGNGGYCTINNTSWSIECVCVPLVVGEIVW